MSLVHADGIYHLPYFCLHTWRSRHFSSKQYEMASVTIGSLCNSVVERRSAESECLTFDSLYGLRNFLGPTLVIRRKYFPLIQLIIRFGFEILRKRVCYRYASMASKHSLNLIWLFHLYYSLRIHSGITSLVGLNCDIKLTVVLLNF